METNETPKLSPSTSPPWSATVKLVIGLTVVAILAVVIISARSIIGPLLLVFILSYLLFPITEHISRLTRLSWQWSANLLFLVILALIISASAWTGVTVFRQIEQLVYAVQNFSTGAIPDVLNQLARQTFQIGPFTFTPADYLDLGTLTSDLIRTLQGIVAQAGSLLTSFASSAASTVGWTLFILLLTYFIVVDAKHLPTRGPHLELPGYAGDLRRLAQELNRVWNAFLRGQLIMALISVTANTILLTILGARLGFAIALLAGMARFVPYVGVWVTYTVAFLLNVFQAHIPFDLNPVVYGLILIGSMNIMDTIFDNFVNPRVMGESLGVHPAAVLVAAIVATNLIGIIGLVLAAPVLATLQVISVYVVRKMFDQDPWPPNEKPPGGEDRTLRRLWSRLRAWWRARTRR
jgi:predicted PurR-regulated permease PerM